MATPPSFGDIGKTVKDIFNKGYDFGIYKMTYKSRTGDNSKFSGNFKINNGTNICDGSMLFDYTIPNSGITVKNKLFKDNSNNTFAYDITAEKEIMKGLKLTTNGAFKSISEYKHTKLKACYTNQGLKLVCDILVNGFSKCKITKLKTSYKQEFINVDCDVDLSKSTISNFCVSQWQRWIFAYSMNFDMNSSKITQNNFSLGYLGFTMSTNIKDSNVYSVSYCRKVSPFLDVAAKISHSKKLACGLAFKYIYSPDTVIGGKIDDNGQIAAYYQLNSKKGISINFSTLIRDDPLKSSGRKFGLGFVFDT